MRRSLVLYSMYDFALDPSKFPNIYEENFILFFISVQTNERCSYDNTITAIQNHLLQADTYAKKALQ